MVPVDGEAIRRDLEWIGNYNGRLWGRLAEYWQAESQHVHIVRDAHAGTFLLTRAYQCLFLETVDLLNLWGPSVKKEVLLPFYNRNFLPRLVHQFRQSCGADLLATHGYPLQAMASLRNLADDLLMTSAAMQRLTNFFELAGYDPKDAPDLERAKKRRIKTERNLWPILTGSKSGLSPETVKNLRLWNDMFDLEVHGARLSFMTVVSWIRGEAPLDVYPHYNQSAAVMFTNRVCEVTWMAHRLLPLLQHSSLEFPEEWRKKWTVLDQRFLDTVQHFSSQQELKLSQAVIDLVSKKFPFHAATLYPLEGTEMELPSAEEPGVGRKDPVGGVCKRLT